MSDYENMKKALDGAREDYEDIWRKDGYIIEIRYPLVRVTMRFCYTPEGTLDYTALLTEED